jgi:hypothetical protein
MAKTKTLNLAKITTRAQAIRALKALGFTDPGYCFTRGAKLLTGFGLSLQLAPANFLVTDKHHDLSFIPMCMKIGNTAENATRQYGLLLALMVEGGIVPANTVPPILGFAVGMGWLAQARERGALVFVAATDHDLSHGSN